jgi:hypothetical protein
MAGKDESARLQGMLSELAGTVGEMGAGRDWGANAIRQIARPDNQAMFRGEEFGLDNSANLMKMGQWAERNGFDDKSRQYLTLAEDYRKRETEEEKARRLQVGRSSVASLQNEYMRVLKDPTLIGRDRDATLADLQGRMNAIAGTVEGMDPVRVGQIGQQSEAADLARRDREQSMDLQAQANERAWASFNLTEEAAARAEAQHQEWVATADYRATERLIKQNEGRYNMGVRAAKALAGTEGGKEKFLSNPAYADMEGVWNAVSRQVEQQQLELENAKEQANQNKYQWTDKKLEELGLGETEIKQLNALAEVNPGTANKMVLNHLERQYAAAEPPTSAMLGLFEAAALDYIEKENINVDPNGLDSEEDKEKAAGTLALKMADRYMATGGNIQEALKVISAESVSGESAGEAESVAEQTARIIAEALAAQQNAADPDQ